MDTSSIELRRDFCSVMRWDSWYISLSKSKKIKNTCVQQYLIGNLIKIKLAKYAMGNINKYHVIKNIMEHYC